MTPAPFVGMLHVDPSRVGGSFASHRHAFGIAPQASIPPREPAVQPPPKRVLAQGSMASPELSQAEIADVQSDLSTLADALEYELEAVKVEADMVSGPTLRVEPDLYKSIAVVGPVLSPRQIRNVVMIDAREIESVVGRVLEGATSPYLTADQRIKLQTVASDANALVNYVQQFDLEPLTGPAAQLAQDHVDTHVKSARELLAAVEKKVVSGEAKSVPIVEPLEKGTPWGAILAIGTIVVVGVIISELA